MNQPHLTRQTSGTVPPARCRAVLFLCTANSAGSQMAEGLPTQARKRTLTQSWPSRFPTEKLIHKDGASPTAANKSAPVLSASPFDKTGFTTKVVEGQLWVFKVAAKEAAEFAKHGELAKSVTKIGIGPNRMTVRSSDAQTIATYLYD